MPSSSMWGQACGCDRNNACCCRGLLLVPVLVSVLIAWWGLTRGERAVLGRKQLRKDDEAGDGRRGWVVEIEKQFP